MSDGSIDAVAAFAPFAPEEWRRLERYAARTRKLYDCAFIQAPNAELTISGGTGLPLVTEVRAGEERDVYEALVLFRPLCLKEESAGFSQVQGMLKRHARAKGTEEGRRAIAAIKTYSQAINHILSEPDVIRLRESHVDGKGSMVLEADVEPRRVFEDFLYGVYFHEDEERIARIGDWAPSDVQRFIFLNTLKRVAGVYTDFAGTPVSILREPSLRGAA